MSMCKYLTFCMVVSASLCDASQKTKEAKPIVSPGSFFFTSADKKLLPLDKVWFEESEWVYDEAAGSTSAGMTNKKAIKLPLDMAQIMEINVLLLYIKNNDIEQLKIDLLNLTDLTDKSNQATSSTTSQQTSAEKNSLAKLRKLCALYKNVKKMEIKKLYPYFHEAIISLLKQESVLQAFIQNPSLLKEIDLPRNLSSGKGLEVLTVDDQEFLRSQLYMDIEIDSSASCFSMNPVNEYLLIGGAHGKHGFFEVLDLYQGAQIKRVEIDDEVEQLEFFGDSKVFTTSERAMHLWDIEGTTEGTPTWWNEMLQGIKKLWSVTLSADRTKVALAVDDKILLANSSTGNHVELSSPSGDKKEKANKKKKKSVLLFFDDDQVLVELRGTGDVLFYSCDNGICISHEQGDGTEFSRYYVNGSSLITISSGLQARTWNCQRVADKRVVQGGNISADSTIFVSRGRPFEMVYGKKLSFYDTSSSEFIEELPFLTGTPIFDTVTLEKDGKLSLAPKPGKTLSLPVLEAPKYMCMSHDGDFLIGAGSKNSIRVWHYFNSRVIEFITSGMNMSQALCVQFLVNKLRARGPRTAKTGTAFDWSFLSQPQMRTIFSSLDHEFRTLLETACGGTIDATTSDSSTSSTTVEKKKKVFNLKKLNLSQTSSLSSPRSPRINRLGKDGSLRGSATQSPLSGSQEKKGSLSSPRATQNGVHAVSESILQGATPPSPLLSSRESRSSRNSPRGAQNGVQVSSESGLQGGAAPSPLLSSRESRSSRNSPRAIQNGVQASSESSQQEVTGLSPLSTSQKLKKSQLTPRVTGSEGQSDSPSGSFREGDTAQQAAASQEGSTSSSLRISLQKRKSISHLDLQNVSGAPAGSPRLGRQQQTSSSSSQTASTSDNAKLALVTPRLDPIGWYRAGLEYYKGREYRYAYDNFTRAYNQEEDKAHQALAARWLGEMALRGWGVEHDFTAAVSYLRIAAAQEVDLAFKADALELLGEIFYYGLGVLSHQTKAYDYFKAVIVIKQASSSTKIRALFLLRRMMRELAGEDLGPGKGYLDSLMNICSTITESDDDVQEGASAWLTRGRLWLDEGGNNADIEKAAKCFIKVAESQADPYIKAEACYRLGKLYYLQSDSLAKAKKYFEKAAEQEINLWAKAMALMNLGHIYRCGNGNKKKPDTKDAIECYEKVIAQSYSIFARAEAAYYGARLYEQGDKDVPVDLAKVLLYDKIAADQHHNRKCRVLSNFSLGMQYYTGTPATQIIFTSAYNHFKRVYKESLDLKLLEEVWYRLAQMTRTGLGGVKKKEQFALSCYRKIYEKGKNQQYIHRALCRLGEDALRGRDFKEAREFLGRARTLDYDGESQREAQALYLQLERQSSSATKK